MLRFTNAVLADRLLSPQYTDWFLSGQEPGTGTPPPRAQGDLGWAGGAPGINSVLNADLATGYTVIVLGNYDPPAAGDVAKAIRRILSGVIKEVPHDTLFGKNPISLRRWRIQSLGIVISGRALDD